MGLNKSNIDYLREANDLIGRPGYSYNIVTGCRHNCHFGCWAAELVRTRLKDSPAYPYGFEPTFHPERIKKIGGKPKLIALNFMGDVGGDWKWRVQGQDIDGDPFPDTLWTSQQIAVAMREFALLNPRHILLLLTKNPAWYALADWPENVIKGFSASNNKELEKRWDEYKGIDWVSLEPWLDRYAPRSHFFRYLKWAVVGGLSGKHSSGISGRTQLFLSMRMITYDHLCPIFVKNNSQWEGELRMYPDSWRVP